MADERLDHLTAAHKALDAAIAAARTGKATVTVTVTVHVKDGTPNAARVSTDKVLR